MQYEYPNRSLSQPLTTTHNQSVSQSVKLHHGTQFNHLHQHFTRLAPALYLTCTSTLRHIHQHFTSLTPALDLTCTRPTTPRISSTFSLIRSRTTCVQALCLEPLCCRLDFSEFNYTNMESLYGLYVSNVKKGLATIQELPSKSVDETTAAVTKPPSSIKDAARRHAASHPSPALKAHPEAESRNSNGRNSKT